MSLPMLVRQYLSDHAVATLSTTIAEEPQKVSVAVNAATPIILALLADKCSTPAGADELLSAIRQAGPATLDRIPTLLTPAEIHHLIDHGSKSLANLRGRQPREELIHAVSRFSSLSHNATRSAVGVCSSISLSTLAQHAETNTAHDLSTYMHGQEDDIRASIPAGMYEYLEDSSTLRPLLHSYDAGVSRTSTDDEMSDESSIHRQEMPPTRKPYSEDEEPLPTGLAWFIPLLVVIAIAAAMVFTLYPSNANNPPQHVRRH